MNIDIWLPPVLAAIIGAVFYTRLGPGRASAVKAMELAMAVDAAVVLAAPDPFELGVFEGLSGAAQDLGTAEKIRFVYFAAGGEKDVEVGTRICLSYRRKANAAH